MPSINVDKIVPQKRPFHNTMIDVRETRVRFEDISYWEGNYRTLLAFELLEKKLHKKIAAMPLESLVDALSENPKLKLAQLAKSIEKNGVRVPLIVLDDGTLLDGNRRYFACAYLKLKTKPRPDVLDNVPVWVIKEKDVDARQKLKIIAEANFVDDFRVEWTPGVKARVVWDYFRKCLKEKKMSSDEAFAEIQDVFSLSKDETGSYVGTIRVADEFVRLERKINEKDKRRVIAEKHFVYFWEFRNKAMGGKLSLNKKELKQVKGLFFKMMLNDRFRNIKQVEPMIRSVRDSYRWSLLEDSGGAKIDQIDALDKEERAIRSSEDKIRHFYEWLTKKADIESFSTATTNLLKKLKNFVDKKY